MYDVVMGATVIVWIATVVGILVRLPIFFKRRRWALLAFVIVPLVGVSLAEMVASPEKKVELAREQAERDAERRTKKEAETVEADPLAITSMKWTATCGGACLTLSGTIQNVTGTDRKDPLIKCTFTGESGSAIGDKTVTLYKLIPAGKTVKFRGLDMGFRPSQATGTDCGVLTSSRTG